MSPSPSLPAIPPPPALTPDLDPSPSSPRIERTNTLALLLPHQALFAPPLLALLRTHYESFGPLAHWAPVRGFGRVIVVWETEADAERAKEQGDWLELDVDLPEVAVAAAREGGGDGGGKVPNGKGQGQGQRQGEVKASGRASASTSRSPTRPAPIDGDGYFTPRKRRKSTAKGVVLRLHRLPPTPLAQPIPHLAVPAHDKNFLISPPGSPPEGWEPIREEGPNTSTLAEDLQRALERVQLNGHHLGSGGGPGHARRGSKEVILEEGGVRVEVEDTSVPAVDVSEHEGEGAWAGSFDVGVVGVDGHGAAEERMDGRAGAGVWSMPGLGMGVVGGGEVPTPGRARIMPTARPPMPE